MHMSVVPMCNSEWMLPCKWARKWTVLSLAQLVEIKHCDKWGKKSWFHPTINWLYLISQSWFLFEATNVSNAALKNHENMRVNGWWRSLHSSWERKKEWLHLYLLIMEQTYFYTAFLRQTVTVPNCYCYTVIRHSTHAVCSHTSTWTPHSNTWTHVHTQT